MKNILWIFSASVVFTLSSCISTAQFNNAEDDVYYSPKASNRKQPVMIPEVNVDEIIKKNPPQYGQPTNRVDDVTPNPNAAEGYRAYRAQQDSLYKQDPSLSGYYVNPNLPNSETDEIARRNNRWYNRSYRNSNNWNYGLGWNSFYGPGLSLGYSNFGYNNYYGNNWGYNNFYPYNSWGYPGYGYNNWNSYYGWNSGFGYGNPYYNNFYGGYPGYGYGYGNYYPHVYYNDNNNSGGSSGNAGNQPISRPRPNVGSTAPPTNNGGQPNNSGQNSGGRNFEVPAQGNTQPAQPATPTNYNRGYTPSGNEQRLENVNGRIIYSRPQEVAPPTQSTNPNRNPDYQRVPDNYNNNNNYTQPSQPSPAPRPSYNEPRNSYSPPPSNNGGGRGSAPAGGGGSSVGGRRR